MLLLLTLNIFHTFSSVPVAEFEPANVSWVPCHMRNKTILSSLMILKNLEVLWLVNEQVYNSLLIWSCLLVTMATSDDVAR